MICRRENLKPWLRSLSAALVVALTAAGFSACSDEGDDPTPVEEPTEEPETGDDGTRMAILVYMVADNSLGRYDFDLYDIEEMKKVVEAGEIGNDSRLIVYNSRPGTESGKPPVMLEVTAAGLDTLKVYPDDPSIYSVDIARMKEALSDFRDFTQAESYGLILWSHASGWIQNSLRPQETTVGASLLTSFGSDRGERMNTTDLAVALKGQNLEFIYFDCCHEATVEVAYELRDAARLMVGSVTELPAEGMPYDKTLPFLFATPADPVGAARTTFDYFDAMEGEERSCTISVIDLTRMDELADATRRIMATTPSQGLPRENYQPFMRSANTLFDLEQYIMTLDGPSDEQKSQWQTALSNAVVFAGATPYLFNRLEILHHCGLATYIINPALGPSYQGYDQLGWWRDVVCYNSLLK